MVQNRNTRVSPGVYRNSQGALVNRAAGQPQGQGTLANGSMVVRRAPGATTTRGVSSTTGLAMAPGQYRGADRTAYQAGQTGTATMAPGQFRGAQRKAYQAGMATRAATPGAPATEDPVATTPQGETPQPMGQDQAGTMKTYNDFLPADVQSSPMFNYRLKQGQQQLDARLAAQGLSGSGAQIRQDLDLVNGLTADETERAMNLAKGEADRYERIAQNQSEMGLRREENQTRNMFDLTRLYLDQNPMQFAYQGTQQYGKATDERGANNARVVRDSYGRVYSRGGGTPPVYDPGYPSAPDYSRVNIARQGMPTSGQNYLNAGMSVLPFLTGR